MPTLVVSRCRRRGVRMRDVVSDGNLLLATMAPGAELSVALVDDLEMQELNRHYRDKDQPTDVLAFPQDAAGDDDQPLLGDVVISLDTALRQANDRGTYPSEEVRTLLVHGFLHLLGYDHEIGPREARRMFRKQKSLLERLSQAEDAWA